MQPQGTGHIVNIGSHSAFTGPAGQTAYAAAKAGLIAFTRSLASELGPHGIRVNCVHPGWLETPFTAGVPKEVSRRALEEHVLGRFNTPAEAARFIVFLHSLSAVSGQVFQLDSRTGHSGR
jgi:3-oxoacyl-[acyl-carrier protein] reductase